jgi:hypothetical protein
VRRFPGRLDAFGVVATTTQWGVQSSKSVDGWTGHLEAPSRASCGSGPGSSGHSEPAATLGQARAGISSQLRFQAKLERPFRTSCGSRPGSPGQFEPAVAPGQARSRGPRQVQCFRGKARHEALKRPKTRGPKETLRIDINIYAYIDSYL